MNVPTPEWWEIFLAPFFIVAALLLAYRVPRGSVREFFITGLSLRIAGGLVFLVIYLFYYGGGDTVAYYLTSKAMLNLILYDPLLGFETYFSAPSYENYTNFNAETGYPLPYIYRETYTAWTSKVYVPFLLLGLKSYLLTTIVVSTVAYFGAWKLFQSFRAVSGSNKISSYAILYFPSPIFWGYGISKDTITFSLTCLLVHYFSNIISSRSIKLSSLPIILSCVFLVLKIKPYVLLVLIPGLSIWYFYSNIQRIKNIFVRTALIPFVILLSSLTLGGALFQFGDALGDYSMDRILDKAIVTQEDLKQEYYGGNSFDIGTIEPTAVGVISKFPIATFFGLFGPTLLHVRNPVSFISAMENTLLLILVIWVFAFRNPITTLRTIFNQPILIFCVAFSIMFAFSIGLTTANFGALVRFKIPLIPFFVFLLLTLVYNTKLRIHHFNSNPSSEENYK